MLKVNILKAVLIGERNELGIMPPETAWELPLSEVPFLGAKN